MEDANIEANSDNYFEHFIVVVKEAT